MREKWIVVYTNSAIDCQWCRRVKEVLNIYGFDFYEKDIATDERYLEEFKSAGHRTVPQVYMEKTLVGGYEATRDYVRETFFSNYPLKRKAEIIEELSNIE